VWQQAAADIDSIYNNSTLAAQFAGRHLSESMVCAVMGHAKCRVQREGRMVKAMSPVVVLLALFAAGMCLARTQNTDPAPAVAKLPSRPRLAS
jgi:hypothetical protein